MREISREEAIKQFGRQVSIKSYNLPNFEYSDDVSKDQLRLQESRWGSGSQQSPLIELEEVLGMHKSNIINTKGKWPDFIDALYDEKDRLLDQEVLDAIKSQAITEYDAARLKIEENQETQRPSGLFSCLTRAKPNALSNGDTVYATLQAKVHYLPDTIQIPETTLKLGDKVFQLVEHDIKNNGTKIIEHTVTDVWPQKLKEQRPKPNAKCSCEFDVVASGSKYDIRYTIKSSETTMPVYFKLNDDGTFKGLTRGDCFTPSGYFFRTKKAAKDRENKIWWDVEKKLKSYRERTGTPSPA